MVPAVWLMVRGQLQWWRLLGFVVGWGSVAIGIAGLVWHLESQFFQRWTLSRSAGARAHLPVWRAVAAVFGHWLARRNNRK